jgi:hypothetical protein
MPMAVREFSLEELLVERFRFSGMDRENLSDLASILASINTKYSILPVAVVPSSESIPTALTAKYMLQSTMLNKLMNLLLDTPRLVQLAVRPYGFPRPTQFELSITIGG